MEATDTTLATGDRPSSTMSTIQELLELLIDNVLSTRECDIAAKGRRLSQGVATSTEKNNITNPLDVISLIRRDTDQSDTLTDLFLLQGHTNVLQLKCVEQKVSGYCGHYALYNILCMLEMHNSQSDKEALEFIKQTSSVGSFWRRYWWSISQLLVRANEENSWPWTEAYIATGDMERSFLNHLLSTDPHVHHLAGEEKIVVLQYAYGFFQNSFNEVCEIQNKIDTFRTSPGHNHISFILGITNHWLGVTVYKTGQLCPCSVNHTPFSGCGSQASHDKIDMIILDSNNNVNVTASNEEIVKRIEKSEKERIAKTGQGYDNWRRAMYTQSHVDQRDVIVKMAKCVGGVLDLRQEKAESYTKQILTSYAKSVDTPLQSSSPDYYLPLLLSWLDNYYPPQILRDGLIPLVSSSVTVSCLSSTTYHELIAWTDSNYLRLKDMSLNGLPGVQMFANIVNQVNRKLQLF